MLTAPESGSCSVPRQRPVHASMAWAARWSPDGIRSLVFAVAGRGRPRARRLRHERRTELTSARSPTMDGRVVRERPRLVAGQQRRIAFNRWQRDDLGEWSDSARSASPRSVAASGPSASVRASDGALIEWSPDGTTHLVATRDPPGGLYLVSPRPLERSPGRPSSISPTGRTTSWTGVSARSRAGSGSRPELAAPTAPFDRTRKNPGWSGPGFKVYAAWLRGEDSNL